MNILEVTHAGTVNKPASVLNYLTTYGSISDFFTMNMTPILITEEEKIMEIKRLEEQGWQMLTDRDALHKEIVFQDFNQAFGFMSRVAMLAENINHHPEWFNAGNRVTITLSTPHENQISSKDILLAKFINLAAKSPCAIVE